MLVIITSLIIRRIKMDYQKEIKNLKEAIESLNLALNKHIGNGGQEHYVANELVAGFLSPTKHRDIDMANGKRKQLAADTDILTLDFGSYVGSNLKNTPIDAQKGDLAFVDVIDGGNGRKTIYYTYSFRNKTFRYQTHTNGNNTQYEQGSYWRNIAEYFIKNEKTTTSTSLVSGEAKCRIVEFEHFRIVRIKFRVSKLSGAESSGVWFNDVMPSYARPDDFISVAISSSVANTHSAIAMLTTDGKIQSWGSELINYPTENFYGSVTYLNFKSEDFPDAWLALS